MIGQALAVPDPRPAACFGAAVAAPTECRPTLAVRLLGPLQVWGGDGADLLPHVRKTRAVLAILALAAPRPVSRAQIIALLWSRRAPPQAHGSLRQAVLDLRQTLGPASHLLQAERLHLALGDAGLRVDAHQILLATPTQPAPLALWRGDLLSDLAGLDPAFDAWLDEQRRRLRQSVRAVAEVVLAAASGPAATAAAAARLLEIDAAHEAAWRALIRSHVERGEFAAANATYERCRAALAAQGLAGPAAETTSPVAPLRRQAALPAVAAPPDTAPGPVLHRRWASVRRLGVAPPRHGTAAGLTELAANFAAELIAALSRFRWLACVPCAAAEADPQVDYLLDSAVQRNEDRLRVLLRLTDRAAGGEVVWAERFDHAIGDGCALPGLLAGIAAARFEPRLWLWEGEQIAARGTAPRTAPELLRLAVPAVFRLDHRRFMAAGKLLDQSVQLDPGNAAAHAWAAQWHIFAVGQGWSLTQAADVERARGLAERAIRLDPDDARGLSLAGHVRGFIDHRPDEARRLHERALEINPSLPLSWCLSSLAHTYAGDCDAAVAQVRHAQALSPHDPLDYLFEMALGLADLLRGDPAGAAQAARRAISLNRGFSSSHKLLLAALGQLGDTAAAAEARAGLLALEPGFTVDEALHRSPITAPAARVLYAEGLRLGGLG